MSGVAGLDDSKLTRAFLEEAEELIARLGEELAAVAAGTASPQAINEIFRIFHSLKSESAILGFARLSSLAHHVEDVLGVARSGSLALEGPALDAVQEGADLIASMIGAIGRGEGEPASDTASLSAELVRLAGGSPGSAAAPAPDHGPPAVGQVGPGPQGTGGTASPPPPRPFTPFERSQVAEAIDRGEQLMRLAFRVDDAEPMKFARAYLVFSNLEQAVNLLKVDPPLAMGEATIEDSRYARVTAWFTGPPEAAREAARVDQVLDVTVEPVEPAAALGEEASRAAATAAAPAVAAAAAAALAQPAPAERTSIRVDTRRLDELWGLVAGLVQQRGRISTLSDRLARGVDPMELRGALAEAADGLATISAGMQQTMVETRMVPISVIFTKFPRLVRDLCRKLGKRIELELTGGETGIDRGIVEALSDPLTHLIRNAIDHGIEFPEERVRLGKAEQGRITIAASRQGGTILIEISDDGRGIDPVTVRSRAVAMGIPGAAEMDERRLLDLVFLPGFSTREVVTDLSGRGVGMDVVSTRVRATLKGEVLLFTEKGHGTRVTLLLPVSLTIMPALLVRGESHLFGIPLSGVDATTRLLNTEIRGSRDRQFCTFQDGELPLYSLSGLLGRPARRAEELEAVIVRHGQDRGCLVVDELLEERELVIRPLDDLVNRDRLYSGVSVLEDGALVFILDTSFVRGGLAPVAGRSAGGT